MMTTTRAAVRSVDGTEIAYETIGSGRGLLVLGGAWRRGRDYRRLARELAPSFSVHLLDRRGRGDSGPQGARYSIEREVEDLQAVQQETGARLVFGHSFGGLIAMEAARRSSAFTDVIAYEPGVSVAGSMPLAWLAPYRELLTAGDRRGAFAAMVRGAGGAPTALERMPLWYVKLILRVFIRGDSWRRVEPLLECALAEHEQVARVAEQPIDRYHEIDARVVLLGGAKSRLHFTTTVFDAISAVIPNADSELIPGLGHTGPDEQAPELVAARVREHVLKAGPSALRR